MDRAWDDSAHCGETAAAGISCYRWRIVDLWIRILFHFISKEGHFGDRDQIALILDASSIVSRALRIAMIRVLT
jgi:hypothetical protein